MKGASSTSVIAEYGKNFLEMHAVEDGHLSEAHRAQQQSARREAECKSDFRQALAH